MSTMCSCKTLYTCWCSLNVSHSPVTLGGPPRGIPYAMMIMELQFYMLLHFKKLLTGFWVLKDIYHHIFVFILHKEFVEVLYVSRISV